MGHDVEGKRRATARHVHAVARSARDRRSRPRSPVHYLCFRPNPLLRQKPLTAVEDEAARDLPQADRLAAAPEEPLERLWVDK
jgi:hypothetical protein